MCVSIDQAGIDEFSLRIKPLRRFIPCSNIVGCAGSDDPAIPYSYSFSNSKCRIDRINSTIDNNEIGFFFVSAGEETNQECSEVYFFHYALLYFSSNFT